jgi:hypothetical protein
VQAAIESSPVNLLQLSRSSAQADKERTTASPISTKNTDDKRRIAPPVDRKIHPNF